MINCWLPTKTVPSSNSQTGTQNAARTEFSKSNENITTEKRKREKKKQRSKDRSGKEARNYEPGPPPRALDTIIEHGLPSAPLFASDSHPGGPPRERDPASPTPTPTHTPWPHPRVTDSGPDRTPVPYVSPPAARTHA